MDQGHPLTVFLVTALILWALYLWGQHRLGLISPKLPLVQFPGGQGPRHPPPPLILGPPTFTPGIAPAPGPSGSPSVLGGS